MTGVRGRVVRSEQEIARRKKEREEAAQREAERKAQEERDR